MKTYKLTSKSGTIYSANTEKDGMALDFDSIGIIVNGAAFRKAQLDEIEVIFSMLAISAIGVVPNGWKFEVIDNADEQAKAAEAKKKEEDAKRRVRRSRALCEIARIADDPRNGTIMDNRQDLLGVVDALQHYIDDFQANI
jgi:hypothetical protein